MFNLAKTIALASVLGAVVLTGQAKADDHGRRLVLVNRTFQVITSFYVSIAGMNDWQDELLGGSLPPSQSVQVEFDASPANCLFDFRIVSDSGDEVIHSSVD